ncbi:MAG: topoisomerase DNA-binding C4 zinc finger domain-containing protein, partial [Clostridia bacterium]|nr:topoisomerase DNA-binding C4 zinc finger domain-containing protein [Clostridia bacterium]
VKFLDEMGIGRPSTFTSIITTIISRGYVARDGKVLKPTPLGDITTDIMKVKFPDIVDYKFTAQMEESLDNIENEKDSGVSVLKNFYSKFAVDLENAFATISKDDIVIPVEETDITCDKCGAKMVIKNGRFGKFAACPNYPECKNTKPIDKNGNLVVKEEKPSEPTGEKCELCGADMVIRTGKFGKFIACSNYPTCKNTKQIVNEAGVNCPDCGGKVLIRQGKRRSVFYSCENYPKCKFSSWDMPLNEKCPDCGKILFKKKAKGTVLCADKSCGYKREETEATNE